ncbi:putative WSS1 Protein involved in sister chromatid separation and segregation [Venustampulla echinocandica]|uniref:Putative WSS1 Protein involved in sister chromatid separation and segregation n=1 Tax=Venustampulla echinocandica TaxID=2656787 RepID=A0A370TF07_9HELO|nr:putative WSS1 Protein involved in sister chromatid separation and segregation [Venustampulla echinocandica]RDL33275.1 putative WSS1 Protein involved in sister chromatid separation and segregation [Venustampulla echinocandica]
MPEHDALVFEYSHLKRLSRENEALHALKKIASLVKPIMRARNWKVGVLAEFYPDQQNLLGINENRGQKICLRLRYPGDVNQFLPLEQVVDTMLHELSHNVHGPHHAEFHALWDQLRKEYEALLSKGYTGEGFLSEGHALGGRRLPMHEARRLARAAAEKRAVLSKGSGQRLGGRPVRVGTDIREVIVNAIERRNTVLKGCGSGNKNDNEIKDLADEATQNGFKTKAEEDEANDRAVAQAVWELVQEDQEKEYGNSYIPSTPGNPTGNGGGSVGPSNAVKAGPSSLPPKQRPTPARQPLKHVSRLVAEPEAKKSKKIPQGNSSVPSAPPPVLISALDPPELASLLTGWTCDVCTLHNPLNFLCCDACTTERPPEITKRIAEDERKKVKTVKLAGSKPATWTCTRCTTAMEDKWWTCSTCGTMKASS